ncbi:putative Co/Zn/Cd efflux system membrane fusion protein [Thioalkalivibrio nitratireducens DSM 14787]|uniref:Co/Zn/Cd efflux system membrane fusion protein n=1 Tax=Thioalkalivibrio nitratireducens (strain DSM 14787 / UNIQEM 213 / ALEN2) TaxID=1255043 RepID=L0DV78_THIND|nr:efflux RND transporter periplasmic adaptor subunit [Thioalkalivibrio nitratireducens]AGA32875.1 putative Co/Zn/Cd efflux system membrane fusion protein [Thioalkalivibrio nitratireducens DSM 14787]
MSKRFVLMLIAVTLVFGGIFGFKAFIDNQIDAFFDSMPMPTATITATEAKMARWTPEIRAVGTLEAVQGAMLSTEVGGIVREILLEPGTEVLEGAMLLRLDTETDRAELASLQAAVRLAEQELQRARRLAQERNISEAEVQRRQTEAEQARAAVAAQQARINQKYLRAPFDGVLGIRRVNLGQYVSPGDGIVALESVDPIYVNFMLAEKRLGQVRAGQPIRLQVDAFAETFEGRISAIEPRVRSGSRTFELQALVSNPEGRLRAGQFARVTLASGDAEEVIVLPQTSIRFNPFGNSVFVIYEDDDGLLRARERFVQTGERRGDLIRVTGGLEPGERVASSGLLKLQNETPVEITEQARPTEDAAPAPDNA